MKAGEAHVVIGAVSRDVLIFVLFELVHELEEVFLAAGLAHVISREVAVHSGTVPVTNEGLTVPLDIDTVFFTEAKEDVTGNPDLVGSVLGTFTEDLEFPLAFGDLGIDTFVVDACVEADVEVLLNDVTGDITYVAVTSAAVVFTLWGGEAVGIFGPTERATFGMEEVFLFESNPESVVFRNGGAGIAGVGSTVRKHDFTHYEEAVLAGTVGVERHGLEHAIRAAAVCLLGGAAIETPHGAIFEREFTGIAFNNLGFAAKVGDRCVTVEPEVFEF